MERIKQRILKLTLEIEDLKNKSKTNPSIFKLCIARREREIAKLREQLEDK